MVGALLAHIVLLVIERYITLRNPVLSEEDKENQDKKNNNRRKTLLKKGQEDQEIP
jgi:hypothetical protein